MKNIQQKFQMCATFPTIFFLFSDSKNTMFKIAKSLNGGIDLMGSSTFLKTCAYAVVKQNCFINAFKNKPLQVYKELLWLNSCVKYILLSFV